MMIVLEYANKERMAIEANAIVRVSEVLMKWDGKEVNGIEIHLMTGVTFSVPDLKRKLLDFIIENRSDGDTWKERTVKVT